MIARHEKLQAMPAADAPAATARAAREDGEPASRAAMPAHACDCHSHIIGPQDRYPMAESRVYTPPPAPVADLQALHRDLGVERSMLVQPSFYGTDNSCLLDALQEFGASARGIAVISAQAPSVELDRLRAGGVVGIRVNKTGGSADPAALRPVLERAARQAAELGWHVQVFLPMKAIETLAPAIEASPVPFVLDHFAGARAAGTGQAGFDRVLGLLKDGKVYVKLSAPYHEAAAPLYAGMEKLAAAFVEANPQRILWGTDWPHTDSRKVPGRKRDDISPFYPIDSRRLLQPLFEWVPESATRKTILVDNPERLFGFS